MKPIKVLCILKGDVLFFPSMKFSIASALLLFLAFSSSGSHAQSDSLKEFHGNSFFIEPIANVGKIVKNYPTFPSLDIAAITELNFAWQTNGKKIWNHNYNFPQAGVSLIFGILGNSSVIGNAYAIMPNMAFNSGRNFEMRLGHGFAYYPLVFDSVTNPTNTLISSHITNIGSFSLTYRKKINDKLVIKAGASSFHFSNGHYQLPNIGINTLMATVGIKYFPGGISAKPERIKTPVEKHPVRFNVRFGAGSHEFGNELGPVGGPKYPVYASSIYLSKLVGRLSNVHAGVTGRYYTNYFEFISDSNVYASNRHLKSSAFSVMLGHEFMCGKFSLLTQGSVNVYNPFYIYYLRYNQNTVFKFVETWFNSRLGFQYYFRDPYAEHRFNMHTGIYINANFGQADYAELSVGFVF